MPDQPRSSSSSAASPAENAGDSSREAGISLDQLSAAFAEMLSSGDDPYATPPHDDDSSASPPPQLGGLAVDRHLPDDRSADVCELTPRSILEAMLFVGSPGNEPLTSEQVAALMRGVRPIEVDELVRELNDHYAANRCPYTILTSGPGYRLALREEFAPLRERFYGKARQARLSQAAIEVLSIVAYNQPISADEIHRLRGLPSGSLLTQLVRRQLLELQRSKDRKASVYRTTDRFLELFGLTSLADLPRSKELEL